MNKLINYFVKQKLIGIALLIVSAIAIFIVKEATITIITIPLGLSLIFSKRMVWKNEYFYEVMNEEEDWD